MDARTLGATGITVTPIGLGCWQFSQGQNFSGRFWATLDAETMDAVVKAALDGGISWFDTAQAYGGGASERALSAGLQAAGVTPGDVVVATKWFPVLKRASDIPGTIGDRLACLTPYPIDLFQVHQPWSISSVKDQMHEMAELVRAGKVRAVGVSNFSADKMTKAILALQAEGLPLASNQVRISLLDRSIETNGVLDAARRHNVTLIAYSPLAQGVLSGKYHDDPGLVQKLPAARRSRVSPLSRFVRPDGLRRTAPLIAELRDVAAAHGATPSQIALAWLLQHYGETVVAIPGASRPQQATEAAGAMDLQLAPDELQRIDRLSAAVAQM